jgi:hypothetical protein
MPLNNPSAEPAPPADRTRGLTRLSPGLTRLTPGLKVKTTSGPDATTAAISEREGSP